MSTGWHMCIILCMQTDVGIASSATFTSEAVVAAAVMILYWHSLAADAQT